MAQLFEKIRQRYQFGPAYHMTHGSNLASIFASGALLSKNSLAALKVSIFDISNPDIQEWRSQKSIPQTNRSIHDYVPLYFGFKTPMVACVQGINEKIVFLRFSLNILELPEVIISDGNARSDNTLFRSFSSPDDLVFLDVRTIHSVKYANDPEKKRRKQAELLVLDRVSVDQILDIICYSEAAKLAVERHAEKAGLCFKIHVNPGWYFQ
jgi:hypothetical protein